MWPQQLVVRTSGDPLALAPAVRRAVWDIDPDQPVSSVRAMSEILDAELASRNTQLTLIGAFAVLALVLAAVGLYGTLSYTVSQSTNEIGLRMALGAEESAVVGSVVRSALATALIGIGIGLVAAFALTRTIAVVPVRREPDGSRDGRSRRRRAAAGRGACGVLSGAPRRERRSGRHVARRNVTERRYLSPSAPLNFA